MRSLRELFELGGARGDETFLVYGDRTISYGAFVTSCRAAAAELAAGPAAIRQGDRVAVAAANCPEWCQTFWSDGSFRRRARGPERLVEERRADLRAQRFRSKGARGRSCPLRPGGRAARTDVPELRVVYLIDAEPDELPPPGGLGRAAPRPGALREPAVDRRLDCEARSRSTRTTPPSSSTRAARPVAPKVRYRAIAG